jgi:hypothetical protein
MNEDINKIPFKVTEKGSLGLLALGDIGIRAWREVKKEANQKRKDAEKK